MGIHDRAYIQNDRPTYGSNPGDWPWTWKLIAINVIIFLVNELSRSPEYPVGFLAEWGALVTEWAVFDFQLWRFFTCQFLHFDIRHIFCNMFGLWLFGTIVENELGRRPFLILYLLSGLSGGIIMTLLILVGFLSDGFAMGASGATFGVTAACAVLAPSLTVLFLFVVPMTMRQMAILVLVISAVTVIRVGPNAGGEACHLGGAAMGWILARNRQWLGNLAKYRVPIRFGSTKWKIKLPNLNALFDDSVSDEELDRLLDKVHNHGIGSLTGGEKAKLNRASKQRRQRD